MRKSWDEHFIRIAQEVASMGTCARRQVGAVLVDFNKNILATGFNGPPPKWEHCRDNPGHECPGASASSGTNLDGCLANHAEINALMHCSNIDKIHAIYTTASPCISCVKALLCTSTLRVVFIETYPHPEASELWSRYSIFKPQQIGAISGHRTWERFNVETKEIEILLSSGLR